jgi:hypothetical protein
VPYTAVYNLLDKNDQVAGRQETYEQGKAFPPTRGANECGYKVSHLVKRPKPK